MSGCGCSLVLWQCYDLVVFASASIDILIYFAFNHAVVNITTKIYNIV